MTARKSKRTTAWRKRKRIEELNARTMDKKEKNQKTQKREKHLPDIFTIMPFGSPSNR